MNLLWYKVNVKRFGLINVHQGYKMVKKKVPMKVY